MGLSPQAKVGLFVIASLIALGAIITWKSDIFLRASGYHLVASFQSIEGLTNGSEVRYRGFDVGKVTKIDPGPDDIKVYALVQEGINIPADSKVRVSYDGIVGLKYLEVLPGKSTALYKPGEVLTGKGTAAIVDFIDIGTKNLEETKRILETFRKVVEDPVVQNAVMDTITNFQKISFDIKQLAEELRTVTSYLASNEFRGNFRMVVNNLRDTTRQMDELTAAVNSIVSDPAFQSNLKGTIGETNKTLTSANEFFSGASRIQAKPSVDMRFGTRANEFKASLDLITTPNDFFRVVMGESAAGGTLGILNVEIGRKLSEAYSMRLGMIENKLGVGVDFKPGPKWKFIGDIFDFNKPQAPRLRLASEYQVAPYVDVTVQADDVLAGPVNYSIGFKVHTATE
ncbi:MAG: MlaD family protein [bacterium]